MSIGSANQVDAWHSTRSFLVKLDVLTNSALWIYIGIQQMPLWCCRGVFLWLPKFYCCDNFDIALVKTIVIPWNVFTLFQAPSHGILTIPGILTH